MTAYPCAAHVYLNIHNKQLQHMEPFPLHASLYNVYTVITRRKNIRQLVAFGSMYLKQLYHFSSLTMGNANALYRCNIIVVIL